MKREDFFELLHCNGQYRFADLFETIDEKTQASILAQADLIDFDMLEGLPRPTEGEEESLVSRGKITPIRTLTIADYAGDVDKYRKVGIDALKKGKVAALMLSGGMGTRLGTKGAKGVVNIGITREVYIFQRLFENMLDVVREADAWFHVFIMTSVLNDESTRTFLADHEYFGYKPEYVHFYMQDMAPCLDSEGNMFLEAPDRIAISPNGNGGFYSSLVRSELDSVLHNGQIEYVNVFAVDNVLQRICDPVFIGGVIDNGAASGAKVVAKASPDEKVGAMCLEDGTPSVVEYYEMTDELKAEKLENGEPAYNYGVILNYLFSVPDTDKVVAQKLPVHKVRKKVPYLGYADGRQYTGPEGPERFDGSGMPIRDDLITVEPDTPNADKLELLCLDLVHLLPSCLPFEVVREKEFAPIKNATGVDSVESAREMLKANGYEL
ncbi:MAG: UTP--glucose-1-phosphate uridylyltransferase [Lachnospiraceae bacterium]|nr:UTP--glucose-1-phosphate uridylyltransferase [Lachnospiraceae bacterium]